ncbi:stage V sporulation protein E [Caldifermentibacillus hisashii]|uniref:Stage V sporulation protein E n=1 Tax=Caldibacillus thermoamylovorans TaxID=35841 RepID=A0A090IUF8_9BACI|nr:MULTISPECIES: stage V sporulation protein E [Bacillaceae]MCB7068569.1 stage V sporulation protein E [Caldibacillus sp. 210928-DFI.2.22]MCB7072030.1 stage V sporulation protein E [Caldibacillus sp. 210928-DFI.2.18]MCM3054955.1 stage V sporulation protein E [Caldibacillus thermoamylovorans]MCM3797597.1 stage V sporulation protein E [Caldibacillus thermoamylovorans]MED3642654.1 stage V sporulation protein E [Caldifermentibacillus hisashii]
MPVKKTTPDFILVIVILALLSLGLIMVYSASAVWADYRFDDSFYFAKRQLLFAIIGLIAMFFIMNIDYWTWRSWSKVILITCFVLLIAVLIPGIGNVRNGSRSWIGVGAFSIQPSEFMKLAMIIYLAKFLSENQKNITSFKKGLVPSLGLVFTAFALIMLQPDLGTGTVMVGTCLIMIFVSGARIAHFIGLGLIGLAGFVGLIAAAPYRIKRITAFLDPWEDPLGSGFQTIQSLYAIGPGGLFGLGLGQSRQKFFYLPEPQTDFIFAILAEELGFIGGAFVLLLFALLLWRGIRTALNAPDLYGSFLAVGIISMVAFQVMINIGVVINLIPVTGITLPFFSYGGSSLTLMLMAMGILLNISRYSRI